MYSVSDLVEIIEQTDSLEEIYNALKHNDSVVRGSAAERLMIITNTIKWALERHALTESNESIKIVIKDFLEDFK